MTRDRLILGHRRVAKLGKKGPAPLSFIDLKSWHKRCCADKRICWDPDVPVDRM